MSKSYVYEFTTHKDELLSILFLPHRMDDVDLCECLNELEAVHGTEVLWEEITGRHIPDIL